MAPLPIDNTRRIWIKYETGGGVSSQTHELMFRFPNSLSPAGFLDDFWDTFSADAGLWDDVLATGWAFLSARYAPDGSSISFSEPLPSGMEAFVGAGQATLSIASQARELNALGRGTTSGRRWTSSLYGVADSGFTDLDFRMTLADESVADLVWNLYDVLSGLGDLITIGEDAVDVYTYLDYNFNSAWETALRI